MAKLYLIIFLMFGVFVEKIFSYTAADATWGKRDEKVCCVLSSTWK